MNPNEIPLGPTFGRDAVNGANGHVRISDLGLEALEPRRSSIPGVLVGDYVIHAFTRVEPFSCVQFPIFVDRCIAFLDKFGSDSDPHFLQGTLFGAFQNNNPAVLMLAAFDQQGEIKAHLFANIEAFGKLGNVGYVIQVQKDVGGVAGFELMRAGIEIAKNWARGHGAKHLLSMALNAKIVKAQHRYGFAPYRFITKLDLEVSNG